ncbi:FAD-dependent oxidoreductase [Acaryochloris sp. CCMEE 5410]|uniref:FAD-dependent oxidoreductase n=1 Tax=Acaryochloris sp. CCMEE 5410 TaxID=310037 RepID=UPI0002484FBB|nr:FAD-dependent oxidoreductase [Acaryochloris sp. CCMEE 5410]KAI9134995.1 FAD-dependent oxidoreductase [Acaryochloris sp. CCMEE 5410]
MAKVVIVGAGPTGAALALTLVQRGIDVTLVEAARNFRRTFRGEGLMPSGLDALEQMGLLGLLETVPHQALTAWEYILEGRRMFQALEPFQANTLPCTLVSQPNLLEALVKQAQQHPQFEWISGTAVKALLHKEHRINGVQLGDGRTLEADLVIGADGRNSLVRQQANLEMETLSHSIDLLWFKLADSSCLPPENIFYAIVHGRQTMGLFRSAEGSLQLAWALYDDDPTDWKQVDWPPKIAAASPPWLAQHLLQHTQEIERPLLLSVVVGRCPQWSMPGLLILGDAAHPMSPIRAQGINMAFRDVIVAANHLVPILQGSVDLDRLDQALPNIQAEREPEIIRAQTLQNEELAQGDRLRHSPLLRGIVKATLPLSSPIIRASWLRRQQQLRQGLTEVRLQV